MVTAGSCFFAAPRTRGRESSARPVALWTRASRSSTALRREVMEEVNLEIATMRYLFSHPNDYAYREISYPTADLFFLCTVKSFETLKALDEVESVEFADPRQLDAEEIAFPSLYKAIQVYLADGHP